ncbi:unnamed protein product, partial [Adineta ricciae]
IEKRILALGKHMNVTCHACFGGRSIDEDMKRLDGGVQVVVGTPGRIYDLLERSTFCTENVKTFVLDDFDELLCMGYRDQIEDISAMLPANLQIIVTLSSPILPDLLEITNKLMSNPMKILTEIEDRTLEGIRQFYVLVEDEEMKFEKLYQLFDGLKMTQSVIYCNTFEKVEWLNEKLRTHHLTVSILDFKMDAAQRDNCIREFRTGASRILLRLDRLENDADIPQVSPVINYDLPIDCEKYVRRVGRRGRFGRNGLAINFITVNERSLLRRIEQQNGIKIEELPAEVASLI